MVYSLVIVLVEAFPKHPLIALRQLMHFVGKLKVIQIQTEVHSGREKVHWKEKQSVKIPLLKFFMHTIIHVYRFKCFAIQLIDNFINQ